MKRVHNLTGSKMESHSLIYKRQLVLGYVNMAITVGRRAGKLFTPQHFFARTAQNSGGTARFWPIFCPPNSRQTRIPAENKTQLADSSMGKQQKQSAPISKTTPPARLHHLSRGSEHQGGDSLKRRMRGA